MNKTVTLNIAVFTAGFITFINMWCTQAILPVLADSFQLSEARAGLTVTAPLVATASMAPVIGMISDSFGRKKFIAGAAFLLVFPTLTAAGAPNFELLVLCRFLQGLTLPFIFTVTVAYIGGETEGGTAAKLVATYAAGSIVGGFLGRFIAGYATAELGWRPAFLAIGLVTFLSAVIIAASLPCERNFKPIQNVRQLVRSFPMHLSDPKLIATYIAGFGVLFSLVAVFTFINFRLAAPPYSLGPAMLGGLFFVYLFGIVACPVAARLANKVGRLRTMIGAIAMVMIGLAITMASSLFLIEFGLALACSGLFIEQTLATAFVSTWARTAKSTAVGLYVTFYYLGGSAGGVVPGWPWLHYGWIGCISIVCLLQAAVLTLTACFWHVHAQPTRGVGTVG